MYYIKYSKILQKWQINYTYHNQPIKHTLHIQPRNYQVSKEVVNKLKFGDVAVMQILTICSTVTDILTLIGSSRCLKDAKTMDMILGDILTDENYHGTQYFWHLAVLISNS